MGENPSRFSDDPRNPVENVSWDDAQQFITKLNQRYPNLNACLPSEAQWEYACRAGTTTAFSFGDNITPEQVNYNGTYPYSDGKRGLNRERTVPVASLPPNPWGLYEVHGNVWEWCEDWHGDNQTHLQMDPRGSDNGANRVLRGGSWIDEGGYVRSASRYGDLPGERRSRNGFRLALGQLEGEGDARARK